MLLIFTQSTKSFTIKSPDLNQITYFKTMYYDHFYKSLSCPIVLLRLMAIPLSRLMKISKNSSLQTRSSRNDLNKLSSDDSLPGPVEENLEFVDHLAGILVGVAHGSHPGGLFAGDSLLESVEEQRCSGELQVGLGHVGIQRIVHGNVAGILNGSWGMNRNFSLFVRDKAVEMVVDHGGLVKVHATVQDSVGDL